MNRVIRRPTVASQARAIGSGHPHVPDAPSVESATAVAFEEGRLAGRAEAAAEGRELALAVNDAIDRALREIGVIRTEATAHWVETAIEIASFLVDSVPEEAARGLLARIHDALGEISDAPLEIQIGPTDLELVDRAFGTRPDIAVIVDTGLRPGEARIGGPSVNADLTRATAIEAVRRALQ